MRCSLRPKLRRLLLSHALLVGLNLLSQHGGMLVIGLADWFEFVGLCLAHLRAAQQGDSFWCLRISLLHIIYSIKVRSIRTLGSCRLAARCSRLVAGFLLPAVSWPSAQRFRYASCISRASTYLRSSSAKRSPASWPGWGRCTCPPVSKLSGCIPCARCDSASWL